MNIKKVLITAYDFIIRKLIEIFGLIIIGLSILLLLALISYSPNDPNFIFPQDTQIRNFLVY